MAEEPSEEKSKKETKSVAYGGGKVSTNVRVESRSPQGEPEVRVETHDSKDGKVETRVDFNELRRAARRAARSKTESDEEQRQGYG